MILSYDYPKLLSNRCMQLMSHRVGHWFTNIKTSRVDSAAVRTGVYASITGTLGEK